MPTLLIGPTPESHMFFSKQDEHALVSFPFLICTVVALLVYIISLYYVDGYFYRPWALDKQKHVSMRRLYFVPNA